MDNHLQPVVAWFASAMQAKLDQNRHKGSWRDDDIWQLYARLMQECGELFEAFLRAGDAREIIEECADVANFALMIADNARAWKEDREDVAYYHSRD